MSPFLTVPTISPVSSHSATRHVNIRCRSHLRSFLLQSQAKEGGPTCPCGPVHSPCQVQPSSRGNSG